jgi:hypothetical protein
MDRQQDRGQDPALTEHEPPEQVRQRRLSRVFGHVLPK